MSSRLLLELTADVARLPSDAPITEHSATLVLDPMGYLSVQITFLGEPVHNLGVLFYAADTRTDRAGAPVLDPRSPDKNQRQHTNAKGIAKLDFLVPVGNYACKIDHQEETLITTVEALDQPFLLALPIGRPCFDLQGVFAVPASSAQQPVDQAKSQACLDRLVEAVPHNIQSFAKANLPVILAEIHQDNITNLAQIAYILATAQFESRLGKYMKEIWGPTSWQKKYDAEGNTLGNQVNDAPNDDYKNGEGYTYRGRGYTQVTGKHNYTYWSQRLFQNDEGVTNPDKLAEPATAAQTMVLGMQEGRFRQHKLDDYITNSDTDFYNARDIINGDKTHVVPPNHQDNGTIIQGYAETFLKVLQECQECRDLYSAK